MGCITIFAPFGSLDSKICIQKGNLPQNGGYLPKGFLMKMTPLPDKSESLKFKFFIFPEKFALPSGLVGLMRRKKKCQGRTICEFGGGDRGETLGCLNFNPLSNMVSYTHYSRIPVIKGGMSLSSI